VGGDYAQYSLGTGSLLDLDDSQPQKQAESLFGVTEQMQSIDLNLNMIDQGPEEPYLRVPHKPVLLASQHGIKNNKAGV
jgi:hypothetical protein